MVWSSIYYIVAAAVYLYTLIVYVPPYFQFKGHLTPKPLLFYDCINCLCIISRYNIHHTGKCLAPQQLNPGIGVEWFLYCEFRLVCNTYLILSNAPTALLIFAALQCYRNVSAYQIWTQLNVLPMLIWLFLMCGVALQRWLVITQVTGTILNENIIPIIRYKVLGKIRSLLHHRTKYNVIIVYFKRGRRTFIFTKTCSW